MFATTAVACILSRLTRLFRGLIRRFRLNQTTTEVKVEVEYTATYSPEDDKLRLRTLDDARLPGEVKAKAKQHKFRWAPKQKLWVAYWSPGAEDFCMELAGYIGEEDTSLEERALERYDRFTGYLLKRTDEAAEATDKVADASVAAHHHLSRAEREALRADKDKAKAANLWAKSEYWQWRSAGVIQSHRYKERPDVRHRRIKKMKADIRRMVSTYTPADADPMEYEGELQYYCGRSGGWATLAVMERRKNKYARWIDHLEMRIAYEEAMLAAQDGDTQAKWNFEVGGKVFLDGGAHGVQEWLTIVKVNISPATGEINSLSCTPSKNISWQKVPKVPVEQVKDYKPPTSEGEQLAKAVKKLPPLCNYNDEPSVEIPNMYYSDRTETWTLLEMTKQEYLRYDKNHRATRAVVGGTHRVRVLYKGMGDHGRYYVFLTDSKVVKPPATRGAANSPLKSDVPVGSEVVGPGTRQKTILDVDERRQEAKSKRKQYEGKAKKLGEKTQVVVADQLFETPDAIISKMLTLAGVSSRDRKSTVADFSCGTGRLLKAAYALGFKRLMGIDISRACIDAVLIWREEQKDPQLNKYGLFLCYDSLEFEPSTGDAVDIMLLNPPFAKAQDIAHVKHGVKHLSRNGVLVAVMAAGPRQRKFVEQHALHFEDLPAGSFKEKGTYVDTLVAVFDSREINE